MNDFKQTLNQMVQKENNNDEGAPFFAIGLILITAAIIIFIISLSEKTDYKFILIPISVSSLLQGFIFLAITKIISHLRDIKSNTQREDIIEIYKNKETILEYGNYLFNKKMFDEANKILTYYINYFPEEAKGYVLRGYIRFNMKTYHDSDEFVDMYKSGKEDARKDWEKAKSLGYEKAQELIDKFIGEGEEEIVKEK
jgi:tetratricopeptide (TPR) repeat protein